MMLCVLCGVCMYGMVWYGRGVQVCMHVWHGRCACMRGMHVVCVVRGVYVVCGV